MSSSILKQQYSELFRHLEKGNVPLIYLPKHRTFGIKVKDSEAFHVIDFCPWTGMKLPKRLDEEYFEILDQLGIEPYEHDKIPDDMKSEEWWIKRKL